ncbi:CAP domain-containing protein [Streptomyces sp. NPDC008313]|uniref:CAP domain-containing protein n=1 Tax=Streptomyces sp. NPDC008313 TaxID=3364826 RepID=UPI0036E9DC47
MGSHRAARPSRSHARRDSGSRVRRTALVLGVATVTAGVGITLVFAGGEDGGSADRVATSAADEASGIEEAGGAAPDTSPSVSASASPHAKPKRTARTAGPSKTAAPGSEPSAKTARRVGGDRTGDGGTGTGAATAPKPQSDSGGANGIEGQVIALVNKERAAAGCSPVTANDRLTRAADGYSDVMAGSGVMSHTGPDGSTMTTRVEAAGYAWSTLGENIARGQGDAASVMDSWMNSPGHRANILNCSFTELGVGVHFGDGGPWWTQDFGAGR